MSKKVSFDARRPSIQQASSVDDWVLDRDTKNREPMKRLTIDVPLGLHGRVKSGCAIENLVIADVVREFLDKRFPRQAGAASKGLHEHGAAS